MIDLHRIARSVREYHQDRLFRLDGKLNPAAFMGAALPFADRVLAACQNFSNPPLPTEHRWLFLGHPEIILAAIAGLTLSKGRKAQSKANSSKEDPHLSVASSTEERALLHAAAHAEGIQFVNVKVLTLRRIGIFHTCSAVGDWPGLPADSARCLRLGQLTGLPTVNMTAGPGWMSANRSVYRAVGHELVLGGGILSENMIDDCLDINAATRRRFNGALEIPFNLEEAPAYDQGGASIRRSTLEEIADYYTRLAQIVYGAEGNLGVEQKRLVAAARLHAKDERIPDEIRFLHGAGMFSAETGEADLRILASVAEHFSSFDREVFIYYFAQMFAQRQYLGNTLKGAVCTEERFDGALHQHSLHIGERWPSGSPFDDYNEPLGASYFPQYELGLARALPYTPLSLSVVQRLGTDNVQLPTMLRQLCPLHCTMAVEEVALILKKTSLYPLNRLMADLSSFLLACHRRSPSALEDACKLAGLASGSPAEIFASLGVEHSWHLDAALNPGQETQAMWMSWLESVESTSGKPFYTPLHLWFVLQDTWEEAAFAHLAKIIIVVQNFYQLVTQRNWVRNRAKSVQASQCVITTNPGAECSVIANS